MIAAEARCKSVVTTAVRKPRVYSSDGTRVFVVGAGEPTRPTPRTAVEIKAARARRKAQRQARRRAR